MQAASRRCVSVKSVNIVLTIQVEPQAFTVAQQSHWGGTFNKLMSNIRSVSLPTFNHRFSWSIVYQVSKFVKHARILFSEAYMYCINRQTGGSKNTLHLMLIFVSWFFSFGKIDNNVICSFLKSDLCRYSQLLWRGGVVDCFSFLSCFQLFIYLSWTSCLSAIEYNEMNA